MQQLDLPLKTNRVQQAMDKARGALEYAKAHPDEQRMTDHESLDVDIESALDDVSEANELAKLIREK